MIRALVEREAEGTPATAARGCQAQVGGVMAGTLSISQQTAVAATLAGSVAEDLNSARGEPPQLAEVPALAD